MKWDVCLYLYIMNIANCPSCKKELIFKSYSGYYRFKKYNRLCRSCCRVKHYKPEDYIRICKICNSNMLYKTISEKNRSDRENRICKKCASFKFNAVRGKKLSDETKEKIRLKSKGRKLNEETKQKLKEKLSGKNNPFYGKKHTDKTIKSNIQKNSGKNHPNFGKKSSEETREKLRVAKLNWLDKSGGRNVHNGKFFNRKACEYLDKLSEESNWNLQHALNGGEVIIGGYSVDGYDKNKNIVVEYDEFRHYDRNGNLKLKDIERMNRICQKIQCEFYRYNELKNELKKYF